MMAALPIPAIKRKNIIMSTVFEAVPAKIPWFEKSRVPEREYVNIIAGRKKAIDPPIR